MATSTTTRRYSLAQSIPAHVFNRIVAHLYELTPDEKCAAIGSFARVCRAWEDHSYRHIVLRGSIPNHSVAMLFLESNEAPVRNRFSATLLVLELQPLDPKYKPKQDRTWAIKVRDSQFDSHAHRDTICGTCKAVICSVERLKAIRGELVEFEVTGGPALRRRPRSLPATRLVLPNLLEWSFVEPVSAAILKLMFNRFDTPALESVWITFIEKDLARDALDAPLRRYFSANGAHLTRLTLGCLADLNSIQTENLAHILRRGLSHCQALDMLVLAFGNTSFKSIVASIPASIPLRRLTIQVRVQTREKYVSVRSAKEAVEMLALPSLARLEVLKIEQVMVVSAVLYNLLLNPDYASVFPLVIPFGAVEHYQFLLKSHWDPLRQLCERRHIELGLSVLPQDDSHSPEHVIANAMSRLGIA
ncbi:BZ3500_MvSof-1268-A1-R1_Chr8-1g09723 [Microbotryum saponariae]|uniref:BZ3500_MvSof-1268-A1-R1_Chr8-1g09723 protein n=1 Tax=Microbotryum saponariae TaxID=289078 RepID=A0A2X0LPW9_9BASI|nr:BZ3500_MvSof-1268-A1-R1_Chr8-1g09723 [Microbotryum saponariae]SDA08009.1 BZ3501_MvSof-1269-A2-R1_Chr8-1g09446 [Microbotryum saponariae]